MLETDYSALPSFSELIDQILHLRNARIIRRRMEGASLRDIGLEEGITRTEARKAEKKALERLFESDPAVREDEYRYLYEHYAVDNAFFDQVENGASLQYYLKSRYDSGIIPIKRALNDSKITQKILERLQFYLQMINDQSTEDTGTEADPNPDYSAQSAEAATASAYTESFLPDDSYSGDVLPDYILEGIDRLFDIFRTGGITDEMTILDQTGIFLFLKILDDRELAATAASFADGSMYSSRLFDNDHQNCRWSYFHHMEANELYDTIKNHAFPFIKNELRIDTDLTYASLSRDLKFLILDAAMLARAVTVIDEITVNPAIPIARIFDTMIRKISPSEGPADLICTVIQPHLEDTVCNPFMDLSLNLSFFSDYIAESNQEELKKVWNKMHYQSEMFHGYSRNDDLTILRISALCMLMRDIESPDYRKIDILNRQPGQKFSNVITAIPSGVTVNKKYVSEAIKKMITSNQPQLMCMYACQEILAEGGTCAMLIPHKCLTEDSVSHRKLRDFYTAEVTLTAIINIPESNQDILIYKNTPAPKDHSVWFAQTGETDPARFKSITDSITDSGSEETSGKAAVFRVPLEELKANGAVLDYNAYNQNAQERSAADAPAEQFDVILRRIYNTQYAVDQTIDEIKDMLEELK